MKRHQLTAHISLFALAMAVSLANAAPSYASYGLNTDDLAVQDKATPVDEPEEKQAENSDNTPPETTETAPEENTEEAAQSEGAVKEEATSEDEAAQDGEEAEKFIFTPADKAAIAKAWGYDNTDLEIDPNVRFGILPNGMRYALRHNETPAKTAVMRMMIELGSVDEAENERGLAHFIEHMAFNGTENVEEGEMIKMLERLGLSFGADTNASTGAFYTKYMLDLPNVRESTINQSLFLLREVADKVSFDPEAVDRERGIILSEMRTRNNYQSQWIDDMTEFFSPDLRSTQRKTIGTKEVLENAPAERMKNLYERYYTPGRTVFVMAGDFDVDEMEQKIARTFHDWQASYGEQPKTERGTINLKRRNKGKTYVHPAITEALLLVNYAPYEKKPDSMAQREKIVALSIAENIVNRRLSRLSREMDPPFLSAQLISSNEDEVAQVSGGAVSSSDGEWEKGLQAFEQELRRALEFGFTNSEMEEHLANMEKAYIDQLGGGDTRRNSELAGQILSFAEDGQLVTTPDNQMARFQELKAKLTPEMLHELFIENYAFVTKPLFHLASKSEVKKGGKAMVKAWKKSRKIAVAPMEESEIREFAYQNFGKPGTITKDETIEGFDIRTMRFDNGVMLNLKKTDFEKDRVIISLRVDGGHQLRTKDDPLSTVMMNMFARGGLEEHTLDNMLSIMAGRSVSFSFGAGEDYFGSYLITTPGDLDMQLKILAAYLTHPGYREEAVQQFRNILPNYYAGLSATPQSAISSNLGRILSDNDPRYSLPEQSDYEQLDFAKLKNVIGDRLSHGAIEIGIVGDFVEEDAIKFVAETFGALPQREEKMRDYTAQLDRTFTQNKGPWVLPHQGEEDQAIISYFWPTTDNKDFGKVTQLELLAETLQLKVTEKIREELSASYSPAASSYNSGIYPGYGYIRITVNTRYEDIKIVSKAIYDIAREMSAPIEAKNEEEKQEAMEKVISSDEITRAKAPIIENLDNNLRENSAWIQLVDSAQSDLQEINRYRASEMAFGAIQQGELITQANLYLNPDNAVIIETVHESHMGEHDGIYNGGEEQAESLEPGTNAAEDSQKSPKETPEEKGEE